MRNDPTVVALVERARQGDQGGWDGIVDRYAPLIWSICRRHRLAPTEIEDVGQNVWLLLVRYLPTLREPAALPGWLAKTTRYECLRIIETNRKLKDGEQPLDFEVEDAAETADDQLLAAELNAALYAAFLHLPDMCRKLLTMLMLQDDPASYTEVETTMNMKVGGIGPTRSRCLKKLRQSPAMAAFLEAEGGRHV
jgi:RNA polymerase sigma factor (sigma-70 family)